MKLQLEIREDLLPVVAEVAQREKRSLKQQLTWILEKALEDILERRTLHATSGVPVPTPDTRQSEYGP